MASGEAPAASAMVGGGDGVLLVVAAAQGHPVEREERAFMSVDAGDRPAVADEDAFAHREAGRSS